jgi:heme-degrading monooxygenase HmoA
MLAMEKPSMFTRTWECEAKVGKKDELTNRLITDLLPILRNQPGFANMIALSDDGHPRHLVYLSFWKSKEDAQQYHRERLRGSKEDCPVPIVTVLPSDLKEKMNVRGCYGPTRGLKGN